VQAVTLADLLTPIDRCALLKLDCEGAEFEILEALPSALASRIDQIAMEYHTPPNGAAKVARLFDLFAGWGFRILHHEAFTLHSGGHVYLKGH
jgi:hypothetical protein